MDEVNFAPDYKNVVLKYYIRKRPFNEPRDPLVLTRAENIHKIRTEKERLPKKRLKNIKHIRDAKEDMIFNRFESIQKIRQAKENDQKFENLTIMENAIRGFSLTANEAVTNTFHLSEKREPANANFATTAVQGIRKLAAVLF